MSLFTIRRTAALIALPLAAGLALAGCASDQQASQGSGGNTDTAYYDAAVQKAKDIAGGQQLGGSIEMVGLLTGSEAQLLQDVYKAFTDATGTKINYTGSQDVTNLVQSRVQAGNPPAVADIMLGVASSYAEQGRLMNLSEVIGSDELSSNYSASLLESASHDGSVFGIYQDFSNFAFWYNPEQYSGPKDPTSWKQITDWTDQQAAAGTPVWCLAQEAGGASGFPGAQFIENLFAKKYGPELLGQWGRGQLSWTSPEVKDAWQMFGSIATDNAKVSGGTQGALAASIATGYNGLVSDPATCQAAVWGTWTPGLIGDAVKPTQNLDFYRVPGDGKYSSTEIFQSSVTVAFDDTPATQAFMKYIESTEAQALLASFDHWTVSNVNVPKDIYSSPLLQKAAETFFNDEVVLSVGPNTLANAAVQSAFWKGVVSYMQDPSQLDAILGTIQAAQASS